MECRLKGHPLMFRRRTLKFQRGSGFTLVELLVAIVVLVIMLVIISGISMEIARAWKNTSGTVEGFRDSRAAFEAMTRTISHATLNTYYDYVDSTGAFRIPGDVNFAPVNYARRSDLQFISGNKGKTLLTTVSQIPYPITHALFFQAPLGETNTSSYTALNSTLNGCGFYVTYGTDPAVPNFLPSTTVPNRYRYRLMQFLEPAEYLSIYDSQTMGTTSAKWNLWFLGPLGISTPTSVSQLAQNVVALIVLPRLSSTDQGNNPATVLAPAYDFDSRDGTNATTFNQLPPVVEITMVVIDEASAIKLGNAATPPNLSQGAAFTNSTQMSNDLDILKNNLSAASGNLAGNKIPLHFRVFHAEVALQSAKWSK